MQEQYLSRRELLKGIGAGALVLGLGNRLSLIKAQEQETNLMSITVDGVEVFYETRGEGVPLLILHGFPLDHEVMLGAYEPIFAERDGFQRIYPDMPGMGFSPVNDKVQNSDDMLRVMTDFIGAVAPDQTFVLAGFSYGGYIAQGMVIQNPDLIDGLMLTAPLVTPDDANRDLPEPVALVVDPEAIEMIPEQALSTILGNTVVQTKPVIQRILTEFGGSLSRGDAEFLGQLRQPENYSLSFDVRDVDVSFDKPTLVVTGRQDSTVGYAEAFPVAQKYPRATYVTLDRAGHGLHIEQDVLFNLLTHEWLDRVEESLAG